MSYVRVIIIIIVHNSNGEGPCRVSAFVTYLVEMRCSYYCRV